MFQTIMYGFFGVLFVGLIAVVGVWLYKRNKE